MPAGILSFTLISFFMGVAGYTNAFVAQYTGAHSADRVGAAIWQGIYFSLVSAGILALFYFLARPLFDLIGHADEVRDLEIAYFKILTLGLAFYLRYRHGNWKQMRIIESAPLEGEQPGGARTIRGPQRR